MYDVGRCRVGCSAQPTPQKYQVFPRFVRQLLPVLCVALLLAGKYDSTIYAQSEVRNRQNQNPRDARTTQATNSALTMREMQTALQKLPWNELSPVAQTKIKGVVSSSPLFHRMPRQRVYADPEIYQFLLRHPDMVIGFWEQLGVTQLSLREVQENHYVLREVGGTIAAIEILHRTDDICIAFAKGEYRGPLLAKAHQGDVILVLRTQYMRDEMNEPMIVCDLDTFIQINSLGADVLVKLFFSSLSKIADSNFEVAVSFVSQVSRAATRTPNSLKDTAEEISSIREEVCVEFCDVVDTVTMRSARRNRSMPLPVAQQRTLPVAVLPQPSIVQPKASQQDFAISIKPPADWGMDHFFDVPKFDDPQFLYEPVRYENANELTAPKLTGTKHTGNTVPKLPKFDW